MKKLQLVFIFLCLIAGTTRAADISWTGAVDNNWHEPGNWDMGIVPGAGDDVYFYDYVEIESSSSIVIHQMIIGTDGYVYLYGNDTGNSFSANTVYANHAYELELAGFGFGVFIVNLDIANMNPGGYVYIEKGTFSGSIQIGSNTLELSGKTYLENGVSISGNIQGNINFLQGFNNQTLFINTSLQIPCSSILTGNISGYGELILQNGLYQFGFDIYGCTFNIPLTVGRYLPSGIVFPTRNVTFNQEVSIGNTVGNWPIFLDPTDNSSISFNDNLDGAYGTLSIGAGGTVNFSNSTVNRGLVIASNAVINKTVFNEGVWFVQGVVDFYSGTFNELFRIDQSATCNILTTQAKSFNKTILIYGTMNWEDGLLGWSTLTSIYVDGSMNIANGDGFTNSFSSDPNFHLYIGETGVINIHRTEPGVPTYPFYFTNYGQINVHAGSALFNRGFFNGADDPLSVTGSGGGDIYIAGGASLMLWTEGGFGDGLFYGYSYSNADTIRLNGHGNLYFYGDDEVRLENVTLVTDNLQVFMGANFTQSGNSTIVIPHHADLSEARSIATSLILNGTSEINAPSITPYPALSISSTITNNGVFTVNSSRPVHFNGGEIVNNGALQFSGSEAHWSLLGGTCLLDNLGSINIEQGHSANIGIPIINSGELTGQGALLWGNSLLQAGTISPGNSPGTLTINPSISTAPTAVFDMEIIGNQHDLLASSGGIGLDGTLRLRFDNPDDGTYTIVSGASRSGTFAQVEHAIGAGAFNPGLPAWASLSYLSNSVQVVVNQAVLPIELLSFTAHAEEHAVQLHWRTASEQHNKGFHIQRSADGTNWRVISFVPGAGNSTEERHYQLTDRQPLHSHSYYRLLQEDEDGKTTLSNIRHVFREEASGYAVFPNPADRRLTLRVQESDAPVYALLRNSAGQIVLQQSSATHLLEFDVEELPAGIYWLEWNCRSGACREKVVLGR